MKKEELNTFGGIILDAAITVHRELGPGLLESAYELALARELQLRNILVSFTWQSLCNGSFDRGRNYFRN